MSVPTSRYERLIQKLRDGEAVVAGVLSGTSADGIDCALCRMAPPLAPELIAFETLPFEEFDDTAARAGSGGAGAALSGRLRRVLDGEAAGPRALSLLSRDLGRAFGRAVARVSKNSGLPVDLIGSHGQTVYHHDGLEELGPATLQLGDGDFVAYEAGAPVVSDFRQGDIAAGGEGAPLSALCDDELFQALARPAAILNLGGIANLTLLDEPGSSPSAFDTGPAGRLLDSLSRLLLGTPWDLDGRCAAAGRADPRLVADWMEHPFFTRQPPKSTGRDTFGPDWIAGVVQQARARGLDPEGHPEHLLASATAFIGETVAVGIERFAPRPPRSLVLCGGGVHNPALVEALRSASKLETFSSARVGVSPDAREAICFALLAARFVLEIASTDERVTGASSGGVLGKFCWSGGESSAFGAPASSFP